jgi:hypothetical protein
MRVSLENPVSRISDRWVPPGTIPADLTHWVEAPFLYRFVTESAADTLAEWPHFNRARTEDRAPEDLLILVGYCYLQAVYHSMDVVRRLEEDPVLYKLRIRFGLRAEQVRRFRRDRRPALVDCLARSLVAIWRTQSGVLAPRASGFERPTEWVEPAFLEPFRLRAQDRIDRAIILDSMAMDF